MYYYYYYYYMFLAKTNNAKYPAKIQKCSIFRKMKRNAGTPTFLI